MAVSVTTKSVHPPAEEIWFSDIEPRRCLASVVDFIRACNESLDVMGENLRPQGAEDFFQRVFRRGGYLQRVFCIGVPQGADTAHTQMGRPTYEAPTI